MAGEKVLIVEDKPENMELIAEYMLRPRGYIPLAASDGEEGLRMALSEEPHLIILDLKMPKMTGLEVLQALKQRQCEIPTILVTAYGSESVVIQAFRLGAKDYICRPFEVEEMLEAIDRALEEDRFQKAQARFLAKLEQMVAELLTLNEKVGESLISPANVEEILKQVVKIAIQVTGGEAGYLVSKDRKEAKLHLRAAHNLEGNTIQEALWDIAEYVLETNQPFNLDYLKQQELSSKARRFVKALLNVPLGVGEELSGVLGVYNRTSDRAFDEGDLHLLCLLARQATIIMKSADIYTRIIYNQSWYEEVEELKSRFISMISQVLRDPLNNINASIEILQKYDAKIDAQRQLLDIILSNAARLNTFIEKVLYISQLEAGFIHVWREPVLILPLVRRIVKVWQDKASEYHFRAILPESAPLVQGDEEKIGIILDNLLENAVNFSPVHKEIAVMVEVEDEKQVVVSAIDHGIGIAPENLEKVFDRFYRVDSNDAQSVYGYGLGLYIAKKLVELQGGKIWAKSKEGFGSCFSFSLPIFIEEGKWEESSVS